MNWIAWVRGHLISVIRFYLLPPYSQKGTELSFCAKYGGLNEYLYSNFRRTNEGLLPELRLARNITIKIVISLEIRRNEIPIILTF